MIKNWLPALLSVGALSLQASPEENLRQQMISHVEKIIIVDTINVNKESFLNAYKIHPSAGSLLDSAEVAEILSDVTFPKSFDKNPGYGFTNEFRDYLIWAQPDTVGMQRLAESVRLGDGSWSRPEFTPLMLDAGFPFMESDGQTLYFASDNENSLGGLDIFITYRDPSDGSFMIPRNLGMPFNSEANDYMMVIDSQTGVGWWASERNGLEDEVTVYIYVLPESRVNVDPDDENIQTYASLSGWEALLDEDAQAVRERFKREIAAIRPVDTRVPEFFLPLPDGRNYRYFSDFANPRAASLMKRYLAEKKNLEDDERKLAQLREQYYLSAGGSSFKSEIIAKERDMRRAYGNLGILLSDIYKAEMTK